jgi:hypothetical protein
LLFIRSTNDIANGDSSRSLRAALEESRADILHQVGDLPDLDPKSPDFFPVVRPRWLGVKDLLALNDESVDYSMIAAAESLLRSGLTTPLVVSASGKIINGKGRLPAFASLGYDEAPCTVVDDSRAEVLSKLVNLVTMDFTLHQQYADVLRFNSFRRANGTKDDVGSAFRFDLYPNGADWESAEAWERWKQHYGCTVLDFGAGLLQDVYRLRAAGVTAIPFEPFLLGRDGGQIDPQAARTLVREFLGHVAGGTRFTSIFQNSVFNSVPFVQDRLKVVTIIASLCGPATKVHACAISAKSTRAKAMVGHMPAPSQEAVAKVSFVLDYEPNVAIAEISTLPKVQKFHMPREWYDLWSTQFRWVKAGTFSDLVTCVCKQPKPVDADELREAIEFEFDLPYPDGSRLGLVDEAKAAFSQRLGLNL